MDKRLKQLREAWILYEKTIAPEEERSDSFCYMLYVDKADEKLFVDLQKSLGLEGDLTESGKFHTTVRYVKDNNWKPFVEYLKSEKLDKVKGRCGHFSLFGEDKSALVIELEGDELQSHFEKYNKWLTDNNYPESDFPDYKPHITLTYQEGVELPEWKSSYEVEVVFSLHVVTNRDYEEVFRERV